MSDFDYADSLSINTQQCQNQDHIDGQHLYYQHMLNLHMNKQSSHRMEQCIHNHANYRPTPEP